MDNPLVSAVTTENKMEKKAEIKYLEMKKASLEIKSKRRKLILTFLGGIIILYGFFLSVFARAPELRLPIILVGVLMGIFVIVFVNIMPDRFTTEMLLNIEKEIDLLQDEDPLTNRSETLFKQHHLELKRYYDLNLKQNSVVFWVGIFCIALGFLFIGITIYLISGNMLSNTQNKMIVAGTGGLAGILSNFIAAIYLKMHTSTIKSLTEFHNRFVNTHHFYFSNFLISQIKDEQKREETLANLALNISNDDNLKEQNPE
ncbi:hypothetical protein MOC26_14580 [Bacillus spizizenii]|uniref:TRADD-N-associated membrane domain-containing protein n=1 Tax=Bacillus inaquosorum TaxID=483913 RepID=UPI00227E66D4|nr:hypothetical protein [Bacillus inaquosorum]MCY8117877.1 hypothetical protein [Bacillus spizizenii]MCY7944491.1 hypothetical protein [Bacillus inaquosorum]MCY8131436.1 hypothetical protein [Bacillus spizizenii]MCY9308008.1 hypothetical protein [Bacillus inaquosorum]MCY9394022.1 hypothetical protein [Bacillus inaquosorum]